MSQLKELGKKTNDEKGIIFNVAHPIEAMFYTDLVAYERLPKVEVLDSLMGEGYTIFINKNGGIDEDVYSEKKYQFVSIAEN